MSRIEELSFVDRPVLGDEVPISVFRIFRQFTALYGEDILGERGIQTIFQYAGKELGLDLGGGLYDESLDAYLSKVTEFVKETKIGLLSASTVNSDVLIFCLDECITCAGMPNIGKKLCHFEVGLVAGIVQAYVKNPVYAFESKCNANGDDCCEVTVELDPMARFRG